MSSIVIHFSDEIFEYSFISGCNLLELLRSKGFAVSAPCGGHGLCGKCRVLMKTAEGTRQVIACRTELTSDCEVFLSDDDSDISWNDASDCLGFEHGRSGYGAAVDLGTTTVAVSLYSLSDGTQLGSASRWNAQKSCGADVISRIGYCIDTADGLGALSQSIRGQILDMLQGLCADNNIALSDVTDGFLAGNTVMEHIFAGIAPDSIAAAPYLPASYFDKGDCVTLGGVPFYLSPCIAGYVGGDITAGLLTDGVYKSQKTVLFIDVGTNGEIVLGDKNSCISCAVASGPAFEGAGISCGMPAADGAVNSVELSDEGLSFEVIGGGEAKGLCGSGLLDLVACLLELGYIDESGCLEDDEGEDVFYLTDTVYLDQRDIRQLQLAKAAVFAGITRLTETQGISYNDIDTLYLSGGFGTRLRSESAVRIGMLPAELAGRIKPLGNTSLTGASVALLNPSKRAELLKIKEKCKYLELSSDAVFNDRFVDAMSFPEQ